MAVRASVICCGVILVWRAMGVAPPPETLTNITPPMLVAPFAHGSKPRTLFDEPVYHSMSPPVMGTSADQEARGSDVLFYLCELEGPL
ncbi:hypothetical protein HRbin08_01897 [bacterium HR08]|nr:hypothetical protein HRbin08_01897 [bacterium HR08]